MVDLIDRQAAIAGFYEMASDIDHLCTVGDYISFLESLPEQPEPKWIPVSKRVPNSDDWVIITILDESGDAPYRYTDFGWYLDAANCWIVGAEQVTDVIAWMPLPRAYKGEEDG